MKKYISLMIFIASFISSSCSTYSVIDSDIETSSKYGKAYFQSWKLEEKDLDEFKKIGRQAIVEDKKMSQQEKKKRLTSIEEMQYADNQYFYFTMAYNLPFLDEELSFKIQIFDASNRDCFLDYSLIPIKYTTISQNGQTDSYNYTYVIRTKGPLSHGIYKMHVNFPDKKIIKYDIKI